MFLLTGYHPDFAFIESLGVKLDPDTKKACDGPGNPRKQHSWALCGGSVVGGRYTGEIFIDKGRFHGKQIVQSLTRKSAQAV